jgi:hypothetical protein
MRLNSYLCNGADQAARVLNGVIADAGPGGPPACTPRIPTIKFLSEETSSPVETTAGDNLRIWMVPGAPHSDAWVLAYASKLVALNHAGQKPEPDNATIQAEAGDYGQQGGLTSAQAAVCQGRTNEYPRRYALDAALQAMVEWTTKGRPAPVVPSIAFNGLAAPLSAGVFQTSAVFQTDEHLNTLGGLRSPVLDVPLSTYNGTVCGLNGSSLAFTPVQLAPLYPTHESYVNQIHAKVQEQVTNGLLVPEDAVDLMQRACASSIGGSPTPAGTCPAVTAKTPYASHRSR